MPATVEQLQHVPLFADLDQRELQSLASSFKERIFEAGSTVVGEGPGGVGFFIIDEGEATVTRDGEELAKLGPGQYFGELALIDEGTRTATITADTDLEVLRPDLLGVPPARRGQLAHRVEAPRRRSRSSYARRART